MSFSVTSASVVFQQMENNIFQDFLNIFTIVYLDKTIIYSKTQEEHCVDLPKDLQSPHEFCLYAKLEKWNKRQDLVFRKPPKAYINLPAPTQA